jgi:hypothetical protein
MLQVGASGIDEQDDDDDNDEVSLGCSVRRHSSLRADEMCLPFS